MNTITVAVFAHRGKRGPRFMAYTRDYNTAWPGCCVHTMQASSGNEAKARAIAEHREKCPVNYGVDA